jgi:hypothetical protein
MEWCLCRAFGCPMVEIFEIQAGGEQSETDQMTSIPGYDQPRFI